MDSYAKSKTPKADRWSWLPDSITGEREARGDYRPRQDMPGPAPAGSECSPGCAWRWVGGCAYAGQLLPDLECRPAPCMVGG